jgi:hypothetical protein
MAALKNTQFTSQLLIFNDINNEIATVPKSLKFLFCKASDHVCYILSISHALLVGKGMITSAWGFPSSMDRVDLFATTTLKNFKINF